MAKQKKKKLKNVQISTEELVPTTIGYISSRQKGPFLLIFIFAVLLGTLYYMPQITNYINMIFNPAAYAESQNQANFVEDNTGSIEELRSDLVLNISGVKFSNFAVKDSELTYTVDESLAKDEFSNYYLETFDRSQRLIERVPISSTSVNSISLSSTAFKFIAISHYDEGTYPNVNLKDSKLTCVKGEETYTYTFQTGGLSTISYVVKMTRTEENSSIYDEKISKFELDAGNTINGISASLSTFTDGFEFTKEEDLLVTSTSTLENGYNYQTKADQIAFEMSTKGYQCS